MSPIVIVLIVVILLGSCVVLAGVSEARRIESSSARGSVFCASCRYNAKGLATPHCPECGTDLRETGLSFSERRTLIAAAPYLILSAIIAALLGLAGWDVVPLPSVETRIDQIALEPSGVDTPGTHILIDNIHERFVWRSNRQRNRRQIVGGPLDHTRIWFHPRAAFRPNTEMVVIDADADGFAFVDPNGGRTAFEEPFDADHARNWFQRNGVSGATLDVAESSAALIPYVDIARAERMFDEDAMWNAPSSPLLGSTGATIGGAVRPVHGAGYMYAAFVFLIWLLIAYWLLRRQMRHEWLPTDADFPLDLRDS